MTTIRMLGPTTADSTTVNMRGYSGVPGGVYDVMDGDAPALAARGWVKVALSGPTSSRPTFSWSSTLGYINSVGTLYLDTSLGKVIAFDGAAWRDPATGAAV